MSNATALGLFRTTKAGLMAAIRSLPDDATVEDAIERLLFIAKVEDGLAQSLAGETLPHAELKQRFGL